MNLPFLFARRYLVSKKSTNAINIISGVSAAGVLVGSLGLILVLSVFNGFEGLVESLYNSFYPDIVITASVGKTFIVSADTLSKLKNIAGVKAVSQTVEETAVFQYGDKTDPAEMKGVDAQYSNVSSVDSNMFHGSYLLKANGINYAVLGAGVEQALGINYDDPLSIMSVYLPKKGTAASVDLEGGLNRGLIKPAGSFTIQQDFDLKYVFVPIDFARELLGYADNEVSSLEISVKPGVNADDVISRLNTFTGDHYVIKNRFQQNSVLYKVMKSEKWAVYAILTLILIVAAFNIIGSLSMLVIEKKKDVSILKTMGAQPSLVMKVFLSEGMLLSLVGCGIGFILAIIICLVQQRFGIIKIGGGSFVVDAYPVKMRISDFILVFVTVLTIGFCSSWFPSRKAALQDAHVSDE